MQPDSPLGLVLGLKEGMHGELEPIEDRHFNHLRSALIFNLLTLPGQVVEVLSRSPVEDYSSDLVVVRFYFMLF